LVHNNNTSTDYWHPQTQLKRHLQILKTAADLHLWTDVSAICTPLTSPPSYAIIIIPDYSPDCVLYWKNSFFCLGLDSAYSINWAQ